MVENNKQYMSKAEFLDSGLCPLSKSQLSWVFKCRADNGFNESFIIINKRCTLVDIEQFFKCIEAKAVAA